MDYVLFYTRKPLACYRTFVRELGREIKEPVEQETQRSNQITTSKKTTA